MRSIFNRAVNGLLNFRSHPIVNLGEGASLPASEVLFVAPTEIGAEKFFTMMRRLLGTLVKNDMKILGAALNHADTLGYACSVNANVETVFCEAFEDLLARRAAAGKPNHWIEITEQGGVPEFACANYLNGLRQKYGVRFALDDVDPSDFASHMRLESLAPAANAIKIDFKVWHRIREAEDPWEAPEVELIRAISKRFGLPIIMEGVSEKDAHLVPLMQSMGVTAQQIFVPHHASPAPAAHSVSEEGTLPPRELAMA